MSLHSYFTWTGSSPINHSWHQKTRDTGLPDGEDFIPLLSPVLTQYRSVTDRQTDGRFCRSIYSACKILGLTPDTAKCRWRWYWYVKYWTICLDIKRNATKWKWKLLRLEWRTIKWLLIAMKLYTTWKEWSDRRVGQIHLIIMLARWRNVENIDS